MNDQENLIATGRVLLYLASKFDEEGNTEQACKFYQRAIQQALYVRRLKDESQPLPPICLTTVRQEKQIFP